MLLDANLRVICNLIKQLTLVFELMVVLVGRQEWQGALSVFGLVHLLHGCLMEHLLGGVHNLTILNHSGVVTNDL